MRIVSNVEDLTREQQVAAEALRPLLNAFPRSGMGIANIVTYAVALSELAPVELVAGVLKCMRTCKFFPTIAEIMDASMDMVKVATDTREKSSDEAWNEVQRQMQEAFIYKTPVFSTPEIEQAAKAMGWISLCETPTDQIGTARAQFRGFYEAACQRSKQSRVNDSVLGVMGGKSKVAELISKSTGALPDIKPKVKDQNATLLRLANDA